MTNQNMTPFKNKPFARGNNVDNVNTECTNLYHKIQAQSEQIKKSDVII